MLELDAILRQTVNVWGLVVFSAVTAERFPTDVIDHDQNHIWLVCCMPVKGLLCDQGRTGKGQTEKQRMMDRDRHEFKKLGERS